MAVGRLQEVVALAVHQGYVDVLPASVHPLEGLLVEEQAQVVPSGQLPHRLHEDLVLVAGRVRVGEERGELELAARHLVVPRGDGDAEPREVALYVLHVAQDAGRYGAEVMVVQLLILRGLRSDQCAAAEPDIRTLLGARTVQEEELLLRTNRHADAADPPASEQLQELEGASFQGVQGPEQGGLQVERGPVAGQEHRGDAERTPFGALHDERGAADVPCVVAPSLEGGSLPRRGEGGGVRLALYQVASPEHVDGGAVGTGQGEGLMLLGRQLGLRMEPVRPVRRPVRDGPVPHRHRHGVRKPRVQFLSPLHRGDKPLVDVLVQFLLHGPAVEDHGPEDLPHRRIFVPQHHHLQALSTKIKQKSA